MAAGDHLVVSHGLYDHHAIDVGDGTVVQYGGGNPWGDDARVEIVTTEAFAGGRRVRIEESSRRWNPARVVERALSRVGERHYSLMFNNCEHFANWCRSGDSSSRQIDRVLERSVSCSSKLAAGIAARSGARYSVKPISRGATPWLLVADAAQLTSELVAAKMGASERHAVSTGQWVGATTSVAIGGVAAGPAGAVVGLACWAAGELIGKRISNALSPRFV